jgi:FtsH-binding integral membrane protein
LKQLDDLLNQWWAPPILILAWLVFIPPQALKSRPRLYWPAVVTTALVPVCFLLLPWSFLLWLLPLVALALLVFGLPEAHTFRHPDFFRIGIIATAVGLVSFLLLPWYLASIAIKELEVPLLILGLFISATLVVGGLQFIGRADKKDFSDNF